MDILGIIYNLFIGPLELFFEVLYAIAYRLIGDPGLSIIFLSLAMNFLVLPLYRRADAMQEAERERAMKMKPWTDHIKKTFKGDERFMMLQTYNRQCGYKPTDALKGSTSLLLEIPFFIAAYHFLSNLQLLHGVPFGPIADLGAPDALIAIGGITINLLPILMTAINLVSAIVYMKGLPLSNKIQMYGIAAIFLVLLYNSPAGLVFYWTLNNVFSLVKNIFYRLKNPGFVLSVIASAAGVALIVAVLFVHPMETAVRQGFLVAAGLALQAPLVRILMKRRTAGKEKKKRLHLPAIPEAAPSDTRTFVFCGLLMALLTGGVVPLAVIQASPSEFVSAANLQTPSWYVAGSLSLAVGTFVIWFGVFYWLMTPRGKTVFTCLMFAALGVAFVDYLLFVPDMGNLSASLQYEQDVEVSSVQVLINLLAALAGGAALVALYLFRDKAARVGCASLCVAAAVISVMGVIDVNRQAAPVIAQFQALIADQDQAEGPGEGADAQGAPGPHAALSKDGHNVVVIMMDRGIGYYVPYLMNENPKLKEQLQGFTYYPNAVSYGVNTNAGVPGVYGGYDYTPESMNARPDMSLEEKTNESLKVMPAIFMENGYDATFFDPTYAGYAWIPDLSVFDDMPGLHAYITMDGTWDTREGFSSGDSRNDRLSRNFFCYSIFRIAPEAFWVTAYDNGNYNSTAAVTGQIRFSGSRSSGMHPEFLDAYSVLQHLPDLTPIEDGSQDTLLVMSNDTTHEPCVLQEPEYVPAQAIDNTAYDEEHFRRYADDGSYLEFPQESGEREHSPIMHYEINMAAMRELGNWFDYLRENGVWDNTRIIIVSDHGRSLLHYPDFFREIGEGSHREGWDLMRANCLLMVKDFDSDEFTVDETFVTNADTPALAMEGLIDNPVNPYTGNPVEAGLGADGAHVIFTEDWNIAENNGNTFLPGNWMSVKGDIHDPDNWEYLGYW